MRIACGIAITKIPALHLRSVDGNRDSLIDLFRTVHRPPGSNPELEFCPGRRRSMQNSEDRADSRLETRIGLKATIEDYFRFAGIYPQTAIN